MKNILRIVLIALITVMASLVFNSCSNNDDSPNIAQEQISIVGLWELDYYLENGVLVEEIACNRKLVYKFFSNQTFSLTTFAGENTSNCVEAIISNGTWEYLENNEFSLLINGSENSELITITFQDNYTKFTIVRDANLTEVYTKG